MYCLHFSFCCRHFQLYFINAGHLLYCTRGRKKKVILHSTQLSFFSVVLTKTGHSTLSNLNYALSVFSLFATKSYLKNTSQSGSKVEEVRKEDRLQQEERKCWRRGFSPILYTSSDRIKIQLVLYCSFAARLWAPARRALSQHIHDVVHYE